MGVVKRSTSIVPKYTALSTDISDNKITGASSHGDIIYLTDTKKYKIIEADTTLSDYIIAIPTESNGAVPVNTQDQHSESVDLYLYRTDANPTLTSAIAVDEVEFNIDSNTNVSDGDAITIYEGSNFYQSIVVSSTATAVAVSTPCDKTFTTDALVDVGPWNMNVDGSSSAQEFNIHPPLDVDFDIYCITISGLDDLEMDSSTFLGIVNNLPRGFLLRVSNGTIKNHGLFVNNNGFKEFGYDVDYVPANKKSQYGLSACKNYSVSNGISLRLEGATVDTISGFVRDNLTTQTLMTVVVRGHVVTD